MSIMTLIVLPLVLAELSQCGPWIAEKAPPVGVNEGTWLGQEQTTCPMAGRYRCSARTPY